MCFRYVPTEDNPADIASYVQEVKLLQNYHLLSGAQWLQNYVCEGLAREWKLSVANTELVTEKQRKQSILWGKAGCGREFSLKETR